MGKEIKFSKRGQVTIFVIIGILIVAVVFLFLFLKSNEEPSTETNPSENPELFLDSCLKEHVENALYEIGRQGGFTQHNVYIPQFQFSDEQNNERTDIEYLCYTNQQYDPCINQEPMLFNHLQDEIGKVIEVDVSECWGALGVKLDEEGYTVDARKEGFSVSLKENYIEVPIYGTLVLTKSGQTTREEDFNSVVPSKFYDLIKAAQKIVNSEALTCTFNYPRYMLIYPYIDINLFVSGDGYKIYTIKHRETGEMFRFAVRGCVYGAGY